MTKTKSGAGALIASVVLIVVGLCCWGVQEVQGPGIAGMSNGFNWGLYIALFEFFMGAASGCLLVASIAYLFKLDFLKPVAPYAALCSFALLAAGGVMIMQDLGRITNMGYMITSTNFDSPLAGDMIIMSFFAVVSLVLAYVALVPLWRETGFVLGRWAQKQDKVDIEKKMDKIARVLSLFGLIIAIATPIITSLIFEEMTARLWWNTPVLTIDFLVLAYAAGAALVALVAAIKAGRYGLESVQPAMGVLTRTAAVLLILHLLLFFGQWGAVAANGSDVSQEVLSVLAACWPLVALIVVCVIVPAVGFFTARGRKSRTFLIWGSVLALVAAFLPRMLMLYVGFDAVPLTIDLYGTGTVWGVPIATGVDSASTFMSAVGYAPTLLEVGVALLPIGLALFIVALCTRRKKAAAA